MDVHMSVSDMIGNTPILKLNHVETKSDVNLFAKLELMNPAGSVKDRVGLAMIEDAERKGLLKPGGTIIEVTAGNTGIGIALGALNKGYRIIFTVPEKLNTRLVMIMGRRSGSRIRLKRLKLPAPSILAASQSESGIPS